MNGRRRKKGRVFFFSFLSRRSLCVRLAIGGGQLFYFIFRPAQLVPSSHPFIFLGPFLFSLRLLLLLSVLISKRNDETGYSSVIACLCVI